jgi:hypothetical protein
MVQIETFLVLLFAYEKSCASLAHKRNPVILYSIRTRATISLGSNGDVHSGVQNKAKIA